MKKLTKGVIAAGGAVALLLSAGGTLAYWSDMINVGGPTAITAGDLRVAQKSAPVWKIKHGTAETTVSDISAVRIVPGEQLVYSSVYEITAQGRNLSFRAGVAEGSITPASAGNAADKALSTELKKTAAFNINGTPGVTSTITHKEDASGTYAVEIDVTLNWPGEGTDAAKSNQAKGGVVNLSQFAVSITQTPAT